VRVLCNALLRWCALLKEPLAGSVVRRPPLLYACDTLLRVRTLVFDATVGSCGGGGRGGRLFCVYTLDGVSAGARG